MIKKISVSILIILLAISLFAGCSVEKSKTGDDNKLNIVCTVFPQYDWVKNILGSKAENANITLLLDSGTDLHSYQATAEDFVTLAQSDLFIYIGGASDNKWVSDALKTAGDINLLNLLSALGSSAKIEEEVAGMQKEDEEEEEEFDEHIWLSLKNAAALCSVICDAICKIDPENTALYRENTENYIADLNSLDAEFEEAVNGSAFNTILFADRFPFRYLCSDYNITPYAAFSGCSAETEASFETIAGLAKAIDELSLPAVAVTESSDKSIAKTVIENTVSKNQKIVVFDSLQSVTKQTLSSGKTYIGSMRENLSALKNALN
ncbi:MAG: zinc ABC transporter substrate-binding protein [Oscillospiraceae bacterium]|nr:zinc ABC transporter substrate-binding protein [Oscillospiraceae bacterium]